MTIRKTSISLASLAALAALAGAQPSQAALMQAVFTGTVSLDIAGIGADMFGLQQGQLVGQTYVMTFRYDTSLGDFGTFQDEAIQEGGSFIGTTSPLLFGRVEINGVTRAIPVPDFSEVSVNTSALGRTPSECVTADGPAVINLDHAGQGPSLSACVSKAGAPITTDFSVPFELHDGETFRVASQILLFDTVGDQAVNEIDVLGNSHDLVVTSVPEPASWALLIAGFGLAGAGLRARRPRTA